MVKRIALAGGGILLLLILLRFGKTSIPKPDLPMSQATVATFDVQAYISHEKQHLTPSQIAFLSKIENSITRGDVKNQAREQLSQLASFWKDSARSFVPYAYYLSEAAKLDNSEKNLTFAARLILQQMRGEDSLELKSWEAQTAASLFERALKLDPDNEDLKVGLGSCYVYGAGMMGDPQQTMRGIQQLLEVVSKDSNNMQAQMVLGIGAVISRQFDKGIERLNKVVAFDPKNIEAVSWLADAYAGAGDNKNAVKWYGKAKDLVHNPEFSKEIDERIKALNQP
ncbi:MAG TPA: hypothetical protein VG847_00205 [Chitinophagaceae bacterium]|nr:hypothetical protein [Chitinophagaceae bacterium]